MAHPSPLPTPERRQIVAKHYSTRDKPQAPPTVGAFDAPLVGCCINHQWMEHIAGSTATLEWEDAWDGTDEEVQFALAQIRKIQEHMNCKCGGGCSVCNANSVANFRLLLELEFIANGLDGIAPSRPDTTFDTDSGDVGNDRIARENALCMAAADYVNTVLDDAVSTALGLGITVATTLGPIVYLVGPMAAAVFVGTTSLFGAAFSSFANDPDIRNDITCCLIDGLTGKTVTQANFKTALDNCGFTPLSDLELMRFIVDETLQDQSNWLAFIRALGAYFSYADIDPIFCFCTEPQFFCDFTIDECGFSPHDGPNGAEAAYDGTAGWESGASGVINHFVNVHETFSEDIAFTSVRIFLTYGGNVAIQYGVKLFDGSMVELFSDTATVGKLEVNHRFTFTEVTGVRHLHICALKTGLETEFPGRIVAVDVEADIAPFVEQPV